jgi:mRNA interferase RelE/StbE
VAKYAIDIKPSARRELENLSDNLIARLVPKIDGLAANPRPSGCRKLRGCKDLWRIRVGDYRVVYIRRPQEGERHPPRPPQGCL